MRRIAVEEHFYTEAFLEYLRSRKEPPRREIIEDAHHNKVERAWDSLYYRDRPLSSSDKLLEMGQKRIDDLDRDGIDVQLLTLSNPGVELFGVRDGARMAKETNDALAAWMQKHPDRFMGNAAVSPEDPHGAAAELERAVKELGFKGVNINSHVHGEYLDDPKFWPIFEKAQELDVPISLHPREPSPDMVKPYSKYPVLLGATLGFGAEVSLHVMRLICGGVFDAYPKLKILLGHLGEGLPFWMWRMDNRWHLSPLSKKLRKKPGEYFKDNVFVTTSGMFSAPAFMCAHATFGVDHILFAVDYPYESNKVAVDFIEALPIPPEDKEKVYHRNAEKLLNIAPQ
jgi:predicted TIM-barrel fold metal-dependent hydrolase